MLRVLSLSFRKSVWIGNVQNFCWLFLAVVQWFGVRDFSLYGKSITVCVFVSVTKRNEYPPTVYPKQVLKIVSAKFWGELVPGIHCGPHTLSLLQFFVKDTKDLESGKEELSGKQFILLRPAYHVVACALE